MLSSEARLRAFVRVHLRQIFIGMCGVLLLALWAAQVTPYLNPADDSGRYMTLGESLARSGDLRLLNDSHRPLDTLYPPGFPLVIAFWLRATGRNPGGVILLVKFTQVLLLAATLPMLWTLLRRARLSFVLSGGALLLYALCPTLAAFGNEVMSEVPFLFLCLAAVVLVERDTRLEPEKDIPPRWKRIASLACAAGAFLTRTAGVTLLFTLVVWFWKRFGRDWGMAALVVLLVVAGGWQWRNRRIIRHHPQIKYSTYLDQFSLRDPSDPKAGRIPLDARHLVERAEGGLPTYIGMIPRAVLQSMSIGSPWFTLFYAAAIPLGALILVGVGIAWRRGMQLSSGFSVLFWLFAAMWPWRSARFIVPLLPFFCVFAALSVQQIAVWLAKRSGEITARLLPAGFALLLLLYFGHVHAETIQRERQPTAPGYKLGRDQPEGGFYAACDWLRQNAEPGAVVMGRPAYLLHLYSGHPATQIEPAMNPRAQEKAYMVPRHVRYLLADVWPWAHSADYLGPYFAMFGDRWRLVWQDPQGSGVRIWQRL